MKEFFYFFRLFIKRLSKRYPSKKVLVLEGGGMRGVFLSGVLQAFVERYYFPWKLIIGSSAGALNGTAYAAGQIHLARDAFFMELHKREFIRMSNILRPEKHILDLDWMVKTIVQGEDPLNLNLLKRTCPVIITATDCRKNTAPKTIYLNTKTADIPTALKASAAIPFLYRNFVQYENKPLLDGALLDPIPYQKALDLGYKENEIVVVLTRKKGYRKKEESFWVRKLLEAYFDDPVHRQLVTSIDNRYQLYNRQLDELENRYAGIKVIYPPEDFRVNRLTKDKEKIMEGFSQGISAAKKFLLFHTD